MITLASDFGSPYPAAMKGVLSSRTDVRLVDISHDLPRGDVRTSAFWLRETLPYFPPATHLVVVDPGVGTDRRAIVVRAGDHVLVGPDNGVLLPAARRLAGLEETGSSDGSNLGTTSDDGALEETLSNDDGSLEAFAVDESGLETPVPSGHHEATGSTTFHGRDVFAPAAAAVETRNGPLETLPWLSRLTGPVDCRLPVADVSEPIAVAGEVLAVDDFGNVITNVPGDVLEEARNVRVNGDRVPVGETFATVAPGEQVALVGSHGYVEFDVNDGRGDDAFGLAVGDEFVLERVPPVDE
ncbi:SAM hydrolase/SAM-dependent halogenase family protein [Natronosalvus halobius]|uniref:SAM hydrolase/SAM-dependent halogenase family protein n=1 Tax=Natronosalvus halobius TaxID=2953746 RepID=UPI0020A04FC1|nr:SAM-dependent chlorinase/fluorinase [Natronosalvus halobius]USZ73172.1 SAM-dependent chlorinase/fluorinase [Natronosalvus halobius]